MQCTDRTQRMWLERGEAIGRWLRSTAGHVASALRRRRARSAGGRGTVRAPQGPLLR